MKDHNGRHIPKYIADKIVPCHWCGDKMLYIYDKEKRDICYPCLLEASLDYAREIKRRGK